METKDGDDTKEENIKISIDSCILNFIVCSGFVGSKINEKVA
jgi:hypothetical protein